MRPKTLADTIKARIQHGMHRGAMVEGSPGLGKTQIMKQIAKDLDIECRVIHAPLMQPEDYGLPVVNVMRDGVKFVVPTEKFPIQGSDCPERGILVLDELSQADNAGQKILANLLQEREIHGQKLKPGWSIIATGNRQSDRAGANRILSHLRNRVTTYEFTPHLDDWVDWYITQPDARIEGIAFLRFRPELLSKFDPQQEVSPTPRAWVEGVFASIDKVPKEAEVETFKGDVGEGAAAEFVAFLQIFRSLPKIEDVFDKPTTTKVPKEAATCYALAGAISTRITVANFADAVKYLDRMAPEYKTLTLRDAIRMTPKLAATPEFAQWVQVSGSQIIF